MYTFASLCWLTGFASPALAAFNVWVWRVGMGQIRHSSIILVNHRACAGRLRPLRLCPDNHVQIFGPLTLSSKHNDLRHLPRFNWSAETFSDRNQTVQSWHFQGRTLIRNKFIYHRVGTQQSAINNRSTRFRQNPGVRLGVKTDSFRRTCLRVSRTQRPPVFGATRRRPHRVERDV